ncbi:choice-of-anchor I family protein [Limnohabitans sp. 2KL-51]|uniref:choice-of-anchor I family protein n=1 Tax=Limnohabitans sp. 2KL-51 TaxID=1977911 RepID=UPI0013047D40|nr:choice-of-anchor I family protein [Limnohabitans sp. 2KL-51]
MNFNLKKTLVYGACSLSLLAALVACGGSDALEQTPVALGLVKLGGFTHQGGEGSAEITAYDAASKKLFVVNGALASLDVLDLTNPAQPTLIKTVTMASLWAEAGAANSVAIHQGMVALAVQASDKTKPGRLIVLRASDYAVLGTAVVGALPDMVTFTPDGKTLLLANEGEPNSYGLPDSVDPDGSISVVDVSGLSLTSSNVVLTAKTADFKAFNDQKDALIASGVRIFGPGATVAQDMEPEYITVSADGKTAYVTLQENNALAIVDIASAKVTAIKALGYKDHSLAGNGLDASDKDSAVNIKTWPVLGMYLPDAIASYSVAGQTYLITANEGDARADWPGYSEEARVKDLALSPALAALKSDAQLGRLTVTKSQGAVNGVYEKLYAYGTRSFSIWNAQGQQVFDSGDQLEQLTKDLPQAKFNASHAGNAQDDRSDNKGPEPEGVIVAQFGQKHYAFIGLERVGGVVVYDVSNPARPVYETYINTRNGATGDLGPEGMHFVPADKSPNGKPLLVIGNEISGTTAIYQINLKY